MMTAPLEILIVDDDELDRLSIIRAMKKSAVSVNFSQASTGEAGLEAARLKHFDVILLDFRLPDRDGIDVLKSLRRDQDSPYTIIMVSRQEDEKLAEVAIEAGAQDFLLKDEVNDRRLLRAMRQAQHRFRLEQALSESHQKVQQMAEKDALTGLSNRFDFERALALAVPRAQREKGRLAVLLLDVDHFKTVNDTYGHAVGDQLLIEVARRLGQVVRGSDVLARLGGDEFVILAQNMERDDQATLLGERIVACFAAPMVFDDTQWTVTTSIGIAVLGDYTHSAMDLMKCADIAMYRAKQGGRNRSHFYSDQLHQDVLRRTSLEKDIRSALANDEFKVYYQAQIRAHDGGLGGVEALLRWEHPRLGLLAPGAFLAMAEEIGLMSDIGQWVMHTACKQLSQWRAAFPMQVLRLAMAVNLSAVQLQETSLFATIDKALSESGLESDCLELEITENVLIRDPKQIASMLTAVAQHGVHLALDDFGTGYSSFEHLQLFPIHSLKIDRSFVAGIGRGAAHEQLLTAMIRFAQTLNLTVVAEGIETREQANFCREKGCDLLQGYHYSMPVAAEPFAAQFLAGLPAPS